MATVERGVIAAGVLLSTTGVALLAGSKPVANFLNNNLKHIPWNFLIGEIYLLLVSLGVSEITGYILKRKLAKYNHMKLVIVDPLLTYALCMRYCIKHDKPIKLFLSTFTSGLVSYVDW